MSDEAAFLQAIIDSPDDDTPRLVFADWLEENGRPERAEFIRLQCASERLSDGDPQRADLREREAKLLHDHRGEWMKDLPEVRGVDWEFRRGFLGGVEVSDWRAFEENATALLAAQPITSLTLRRFDYGPISTPTLPPAGVQANRAQMMMVRQTALEVFNATAAGHRAGAMLALACSPVLGRLTELRLAGLRLTDGEAAVLAQNPHWGAIQTLELSGNQLTAEGVRRLVGATGSGLRRLGLRRNRFEGPEARLVETLGRCRLISLDLSDNALGGETAARLARRPSMGDLTALAFNGSSLGTEGVAALGNSRHLTKLRALGLNFNRFEDAGARAVADAEGFASLASVDLSANRIGPKGVRYLVKSRHLKGLAELDLSVNPLGDAGVKALAGWGGLAALSKLNLRATGTGPRGADALASSGHLGRLSWLDLGNNRLGDAGVTALADSPALAGLRWLKLATNGVGEEGAKALAGSPHLESLLGLDLWGNQLNARALRRLRARFGERLTV